MQKFSWSKLFQGAAIPAGSRIYTGTLEVPDYLPPGSLWHMEAEFRHLLWPKVNKEGFVRLGREFRWGERGRILHYRIIDIPA